MAKPPKSFVKCVLQHLQAGLQSEGRKKRSPISFTRELTPEVTGIVTLGANVYDDATLQIDPSVGVRHERVERLLAELTGQNHRGSLAATIGSAIGYLTPRKQFLIFAPFSVEDDPVPGAQQIVATIKRYGFTWMEENQTLDAMMKAMSDFKYVDRWHARFRMPLIQYLLGDYEAARVSVERGLVEIGDSQGPLSDQFKRLAEGLLERFDKLRAAPPQN
jgi:hypothetical protein